MEEDVSVSAIIDIIKNCTDGIATAEIANGLR
jgi:hypothetical protein